MEKKKKIGYFKRFKMAIFELENYIEFLVERLGKAVGFCIKTILILSLIMAISNIVFIYIKFGSPAKYVDFMVPNFEYSDNKISIDEEDTNTPERKMVVSVIKKLDTTYREIFRGENFNKSDLLNYISNNERNVVLIAGCAIFFDSFIELLLFWILMSIMTSFVGWLVLKFSRIKMRLSKLYILSIYSSTLTIILTALYTLLNICFGIYIEIFDYLSMIISYIYITAVIYMIKSDLVKEQYELIRIASEQAKIKEKMEQEEKDRKQEEKDKQPDSDEKTKEDKKEDGKEDNGIESKAPADDEPDGSEI